MWKWKEAFSAFGTKRKRERSWNLKCQFSSIVGCWYKFYFEFNYKLFQYSFCNPLLVTVIVRGRCQFWKKKKNRFFESKLLFLGKEITEIWTKALRQTINESFCFQLNFSYKSKVNTDTLTSNLLSYILDNSCCKQQENSLNFNFMASNNTKSYSDFVFMVIALSQSHEMMDQGDLLLIKKKTLFLIQI